MLTVVHVWRRTLFPLLTPAKVTGMELVLRLRQFCNNVLFCSFLFLSSIIYSVVVCLLMFVCCCLFVVVCLFGLFFGGGVNLSFAYFRHSEQDITFEQDNSVRNVGRYSSLLACVGGSIHTFEHSNIRTCGVFLHP